MADRSFILAHNVLGSHRLGATEDEERRAINDLISEALRADNARGGWLERQRALTRLRYGIRDPKTFPWRGASNLSIPLIDQQIRRYKPLLMRLVVEADPIVEFVGEDPDAVAAERKAEAEYNWLFKQHMDAVEPLAYVTDAICHRGYGIAQIGWDYRTEHVVRVIEPKALIPPGAQQVPDPTENPDFYVALIVREYQLDIQDPRVAKALTDVSSQIANGKEFVRLAFRKVVADKPALWDRDPVQIIVPPRTTDYANCEWIIVQHVFSARRIKQMEADGFFQRGFYEKIASARRARGTQRIDDIPFSDSLREEKNEADRRENIWGQEDDDNILLWEYYHWHDLNSDGLSERAITWLHPATRTKGSTREYPYPFHRWPFQKIDFEKTSRRFHSSRGISGLLEHVQRQINAEHNARIDGMTLRNAPVYQMPVVSGFKARNFRAVPGTVLQLPMGARLEPVGQDHSAWPASYQEENLLRALAESYVGNFDSAVMAPGASTRRTATEVQAAVQLAASTASLDAIIFQIAMKEIHHMIWALWLEFRPATVSYKVQGLDPQDPDAKLITVSKAEIDKKFKLVPTGTIANTNRALELQSAREALSFFANDQTGYVDPYELRNWYFTLLDFRRARKVMNSPQDAAHLQVLMQAAAELQQDPTLAASAGASPRRPPAEATQTEVERPKE